jgi:hypothetical protein
MAASSRLGGRALHRQHVLTAFYLMHPWQQHCLCVLIAVCAGKYACRQVVCTLSYVIYQAPAVGRVAPV